MAKATGTSSEAILGPGTKVKGRITGSGNLTVEGTVEGDIVLSGNLVLGEEASCRSSVQADDVTVGGRLDGDITARGAVTLRAGARVHGNVRGESLAMEDGADFQGQIECDFDLPPILAGGEGRGRHARPGRD